MKAAPSYCKTKGRAKQPPAAQASARKQAQVYLQEFNMAKRARDMREQGATNPHAKRAKAKDWFDPTYETQPDTSLPDPFGPYDNWRRHPQIEAPIEVNGERFMAMVDSGAETSTVDIKVLEEQGLQELMQPIPDGEHEVLRTASDEVTIKRLGTIKLELAFGEHRMPYKFEVIDGDDDFIIGRDLFGPLGITVGGLPFAWPSEQDGVHRAALAAEEEEKLRERPKPFSVQHRLKPEWFDFLAHAIAPELRELAELDPLVDACSDIPEATMWLPLGLPGSWRHQYKIPEAAEPFADEQILKWATARVIEPASASVDFNTPVMAVAKKDPAGLKTSWRICMDFRHINAALLPNIAQFGAERMPHLHEEFEKTRGFKFGSMVDLTGAYTQVPVAEADRDKTTFTHKGKRWRWARWPFGLSPAPPKFQKVMEIVLEGIDGVIVWIDDIFVYGGDTIEEHAALVKKVLQRLIDNNLRINPDKCHFGYQEVLMLGHMVTGEGRSIDPLKAEQALQWPIPKSSKDIQRFLGFTNFVAEYVKDYAKIVAPLNALRADKDGKVRKFDMAQEHPEALASFQFLGRALNSSPVLNRPDPALEFKVACDASRLGLGAMLYQEMKDGKRRYIAFASTSLKGGQKNYGATKRELLGLVFALRKFHDFIYGRQFTLFTDHKALTALFTAPKLSYVLQDWMGTILDYTFEVRHRPGTQMDMPDALSRVYTEQPDGEEDAAAGMTATVFQRAVKLAAMKMRSAKGKATPARKKNKRKRDEEVHASWALSKPGNVRPGQERKTTAEVNFDLGETDPEALAELEALEREQDALDEEVEAYAKDEQQEFVDEQVFMQQNQLLQRLPFDELSRYADRELAEFIAERHLKITPKDKQRESLLRQYHAEAHFGAEDLYKSIWRAGFYWPGLRKQCRETIERCKPCLQYNIGREGFHPVKSLKADHIWDHVVVDTAGPFPVSEEGNAYIIIIVDVKSRFVVTKPVPNLQMTTMAKALYEVFALFGPPQIMQSDNGTEYINQLVTQLCKQAGVAHRSTAPWNPRANGLAEAFVKIIKGALKKALEGAFDKWDKALPGVTLAVNKHDANLSKTAPFTLFFGRPVNDWQDYSISSLMGPLVQQLDEDVNEQSIDVEQLQQQQQVRSIVMPAIQRALDARQQIINTTLDAKRKAVVRRYPVGATVFIINEDFASKLDPLWVGPFVVQRQSAKSQAYYLKDQEGEKLNRPIPVSKIKWVSDEAVRLFSHQGVAIDAAAERGVLKTIIKTRSTDGRTYYLVNWKDASEPNEWLLPEDFDDPSFLADYWRKTKPAKKRKRKEQPAEEKEKQVAEPAPKVAVDDNVAIGWMLQVPASWWGNQWAKQEYGKDWKKAVEICKVRSPVDDRGKKWLVLNLGDKQESKMATSAVIEYHRAYLRAQ